MSPEATVQLIYTITGSIFLIALFAGFGRTVARVFFYYRKKTERPRLLTRDFIVLGGLCISFGLITAVRFLPIEVRQALTTGNVAWALATTIPACVGVLVYLYYEVAVIERLKR